MGTTADARCQSRDPLAHLLARLDLAPAGADAFEAPPVSGVRRIFGGLLAAQSAVAAMRSVRSKRLHSLHGYFLRPGRPGVPVRFEVTRLRDGRSFAFRRVLARQLTEPVFELVASFTDHESGIAHAHEPPLGPGLGCDPAALPRPETLPDWETLRAAETGEPPRPPDAVEVRVVQPEDDRPGAPAPPRRLAWMRARGALPADPRIHAALLVYASDRALLRTAARLHGGMHRRLPASLDHSVWLHRSAGTPGWRGFDDWVLYACEAPVARDGRAWVLGRMLARDGSRIATVAQEGLLRRRAVGRTGSGAGSRGGP